MSYKLRASVTPATLGVASTCLEWKVDWKAGGAGRRSQARLCDNTLPMGIGPKH